MAHVIEDNLGVEHEKTENITWTIWYLNMCITIPHVTFKGVKNGAFEVFFFVMETYVKTNTYKHRKIPHLSVYGVFYDQFVMQGKMPHCCLCMSVCVLYDQFMWNLHIHTHTRATYFLWDIRWKRNFITYYELLYIHTHESLYSSFFFFYANFTLYYRCYCSWCV